VDGQVELQPNVNLKKKYQWGKLDKVFTKIYIGQKRLYCVPSQNKMKQVEEQYFRDFMQVISWASFQDYLQHAARKLKVIEEHKENWKLTKCSCWQWCKFYKCKHMLSFSERKKLFDYPQTAKDVKLGMNRRRGRPRLTAAALVYQYGEFQDEYVLSDTESESDTPKPKKTSKRKKPAPESEDEYDIFAEPVPVVQVVAASTSKTASKIVITKKSAPKPAAKKASKQAVEPAIEPAVEPRVTRASKKANNHQFFLFSYFFLFLFCIL